MNSLVKFEYNNINYFIFEIQYIYILYIHITNIFNKSIM